MQYSNKLLIINLLASLYSLGRPMQEKDKETQNTWYSQLLNWLVTEKKVMCNVVSPQPPTNFMNSIVVNFR